MEIRGRNFDSYFLCYACHSTAKTLIFMMYREKVTFIQPVINVQYMHWHAKVGLPFFLITPCIGSITSG